MIVYENECCGCAVPSYPCLGDSCKNRHVPHYYCDKCGQEFDELYDFDGDAQLCAECLLENFDKIK